MGDTAVVVRHASRVIKSVHGDQYAGVAPHVAKSWSRCLTEYGIEPAGARATEVLEPGQLRERQQRLGELFGVACAEMESLYEQIAGSGYAVILADGDATILHTISDPTLQARVPPRRPVARCDVGRAPRGHQWHRHLRRRARAGHGAPR